jgi:Carboxypeptidase regulatory-like domain/TonB dependent receptor
MRTNGYQTKLPSRLLMKYQARVAVLFFLFLSLTSPLRAQLDQGTITGVVQDSSGAVVPKADVKLTDIDTANTFIAHTDESGVYVFSPIKIGHYSLSVSAPGFRTTIQNNLQLNLEQRLSIPVVLHPGTAIESVTVSDAPPLLQTQEASVGQVISAETINNTPLNGRNWVYIAQLTAGVIPGYLGRGVGTGDFQANGQLIEQNNFVLDGVDNNVNVVDFLNGSSYVVRPPPDALAEFKIDTTNYTAESGHSAGALVNASIKSGSNELHGDVWEYFRNDALNARNFNALTIPKYRENQFGATLGLPILRNRLFFFGDAEANRIIFAETNTLTVPTALMRQGNFTEILSPSLTGGSVPVTLYQPGSGGTQVLSCNGQNNVFCPSQINTIAQTVLNLYPAPNANGGRTFNNYIVNRNVSDNTFQWDTRFDWNITTKDQAFARYSYSHEPQHRPPPLGEILDGASFGDVEVETNLGENLAFSETHIFNPNLINEFRFGYNYGRFLNLQAFANTNLSAQYGFGGIPFIAGQFYGGLPPTTVTGLSTFGSAGNMPAIEHENVYQILDNVTKIAGNHSLKMGVNFQSIRVGTIQPPNLHGSYGFSGYSTSKLSAANTGFGAADFLADQVNTASITYSSPINTARWYRAAYFQDDWKVNTKLTLNLGLRYDYMQQPRETAGYQANFIPTSLGVGTGTGIYVLPNRDRNVYLAPAFLTKLAKDNISLQYSNIPSLLVSQKDNFAPRIGFAYQLKPNTVVRSGMGIFYGGLQSLGGTVQRNYPFLFIDTFPRGNCGAGFGNCPGNGLTLETGFSTALQQGLQNFLATPTFTAFGRQSTPYSIQWNLTVERSLSPNIVASVGYVGNVARHLQGNQTPNAAGALVNPANSLQPTLAFPDFGAVNDIGTIGASSYNSMQARIEKRYASGMNFLATYTLSHSLDDSNGGFENNNNFFTNIALLPISSNYASSDSDTRQRFTFNGFYQLPFGRGRHLLNSGGVIGMIAGGWATSLTFVAQSGQPFTVTAANLTGAAGMTSVNAILVADPFKAGGHPDPSNPSITCATTTRSLAHWYNPCAFANPKSGSTIPLSGPGSQITDPAQILQFRGAARNTVTGPGFERINLSVFRDFQTFENQRLQFRVDAFNALNTPAYGAVSTANDGATGGLITAPRTLQNFTPDARFFQLSAKYIF